MFRRTLVSELRPPAHRPNWLRPGPYLTLLTHSNLLLRPRRPLLPTTRSNLHVLLLRDPTLLSPPLPPRPSPLRPLPSLTLVRPLRVAGHRRAAGHHRAAPSSSTPCLHGTHRASLYSSPCLGLRLSHCARTPTTDLELRRFKCATWHPHLQGTPPSSTKVVYKLRSAAVGVRMSAKTSHPL